jgi:hypothetical protein
LPLKGSSLPKTTKTAQKTKENNNKGRERLLLLFFFEIHKETRCPLFA